MILIGRHSNLESGLTSAQGRDSKISGARRTGTFRHGRTPVELGPSDLPHSPRWRHVSTLRPPRHPLRPAAALLRSRPAQPSGQAGGHSGGQEKQRHQGHLDDLAVERHRRAVLQSLRRLERHRADQRHHDHQSSDRDHQLHADLLRTRRVCLAVGGGRGDLARPDDHPGGITRRRLPTAACPA